MLPEFPKDLEQFRILQWCFGIAGILWVFFGALKSWHKMMRAEARQDEDASRPPAPPAPSIPEQFHFDGPRHQLYRLDRIEADLDNLEDLIKKSSERIDKALQAIVRLLRRRLKD